MYIDKYKLEDVGYEDEDGCYHEDGLSLIGEWLGFCGCGNPQAAFTYVRDILELYDQRPGWEACTDYFESDGEMYTILYLLTDKGLMDHGTTVTSGWLTEKGKEVLADLTALLAAEG